MATFLFCDDGHIELQAKILREAQIRDIGKLIKAVHARHIFRMEGAILRYRHALLQYVTPFAFHMAAQHEPTIKKVVERLRMIAEPFVKNAAADGYTRALIDLQSRGWLHKVHAPIDAPKAVVLSILIENDAYLEGFADDMKQGLTQALIVSRAKMYSHYLWRASERAYTECLKEFQAFLPVQHTVKEVGGPGSGNFNHPGNPGHVGGSGKSLADITAELEKHYTTFIDGKPDSEQGKYYDKLSALNSERQDIQTRNRWERVQAALPEKIPTGQAIGLRGDPKQYKIGDVLPESRKWSHDTDKPGGKPTNRTLTGVSAIKIFPKDGFSEKNRLAVARSFAYSRDDYEADRHYTYLLCSTIGSHAGQDNGEVVLDGATVIGIVGGPHIKESMHEGMIPLLEIGNVNFGNRGHVGRKGFVGGSGPSDIISKALSNLRQGGFTISLRGRIPKIGFSVAGLLNDKGDRTEHIFPVDYRPNRADAKEYIKANSADLRKPGRFFGGWIEEAAVHFDTPEVILDRKEALTHAWVRREIGIYDFKTGATITVRKDGKRPTGREKKSQLNEAQKTKQYPPNLRVLIGNDLTDDEMADAMIEELEKYWTAYDKLNESKK